MNRTINIHDIKNQPRIQIHPVGTHLSTIEHIFFLMNQTNIDWIISIAHNCKQQTLYNSKLFFSYLTIYNLYKKKKKKKKLNYM